MRPVSGAQARRPRRLGLHMRGVHDVGPFSARPTGHGAKEPISSSNIAAELGIPAGLDMTPEAQRSAFEADQARKRAQWKGRRRRRREG